jgi:hypothetical protein
VQLYHAVAHTLLTAPGPLSVPAVAWRLMHRLRAAWPTGLAACVMPSHVHLIVQAPSSERVRRHMAQVLGGLSHHFGLRRLWAPVPPPREIPDPNHLLRQIRYVHLNPCRAGLVHDPMSWPWSTHRGVLGAEVSPWVSAARLADALGRSPRDFARWLHGYVSADPTAAVEGTSLPTPASPQGVPSAPLARVIEAAAAATPWSAAHVRRHAAVLLAMHQGWRSSAAVGRALGISARRVRVLAGEPDAQLLAAAVLCLGDVRLRTDSRFASDLRKSGAGQLPECSDSAAFRTFRASQL